MTLPSPDLAWTEGVPRSLRFGDIYYAPADGWAETRHVFLAGIGAPAVWAGVGDFVVGETGFGSGLNFLATWDLWRRTAAAGARLHYVAVEGFPLAAADLAATGARWPDLAPLVAELVAAYPPRVPGFHTLDLDGGRVRLMLLFGPVTEMLASLEAQVDAWFLDGFAPSRNPEMWSEPVFRAVARLAKPGAVLASFTVAGPVRRGLAAVGFTVSKAPGFAGKRECLRAVFTGPGPTIAEAKPWFAPGPAAPGLSVAVIGGGIAGLLMARALTAGGARATLYERNNQLAAAASGNPRAVIEPWLDLGQTATAAFSVAASLHGLRWYQAEGGGAFAPTGVLALARDGATAARHEKLMASGLLPPTDMLALTAAEASARAGVALDHGGLYFPAAGLVDTGVLAAQLAAGFAVRTGVEVAALDRADDGWRLLATDGAVLGVADAVVLATAGDAARLAGFPLGLVARRGEVTLLPSAGALAGLQTVVSDGGYVTPAFAGAAGPTHLLGATFDHVAPGSDDWQALRPESRARNLATLAGLIPGIALPDPARLGGRAGLRATTVDHLPIVGAVPDLGHYGGPAYGDLHHGRRGPYPLARYRSGLYVLTALGSRGFLTAPLLAAALAAMVLGRPNPLPRPLLDALHPARFLIRDLIRNKKMG